MSKLAIDMSMSLDGFIAGPNATPNNPLGDGGDRLHAWLFEDLEALKSLSKNTGAIIMGRRMYDESINWWNGKGPLGDVPCFVLTEKGTEPEEYSEIFTFVTDGIEKALALAEEAARGKVVGLAGGATTDQRYLKAGLVDEINVHLIPVLLGDGTKLFGRLGKIIELQKLSAKDAPDATHLVYKVK